MPHIIRCLMALSPVNQTGATTTTESSVQALSSSCNCTQVVPISAIDRRVLTLRIHASQNPPVALMCWPTSHNFQPDSVAHSEPTYHGNRHRIIHPASSIQLRLPKAPGSAQPNIPVVLMPERIRRSAQRSCDRKCTRCQPFYPNQQYFPLKRNKLIGGKPCQNGNLE